jgi:GDPmannose 4,6-dehydratase
LSESTAPAARTAVITGARGQDGRLLAAHLLGCGYRVVGVVKPHQLTADDEAREHLHYVTTDLLDPAAVRGLLESWQPDELYHLAAVHHSSQQSQLSRVAGLRHAMLEHNFLSTETIALSISELGLSCHLVFAASSQMYTAENPVKWVDESTPARPSTFYGHTKAWSKDLLTFLRTETGLLASTAILFNHESPLRAPQFVSRKITRAAAAALRGQPIDLELMNLGTRVDWTAASDVVCALHLMAQAPGGDDFVVASGTLHSVRDLLDQAFSARGIDWTRTTRFEKDEPHAALAGRSDRLRERLGWRPAASFAAMVDAMVESDLVASRQEDKSSPPVML